MDLTELSKLLGLADGADMAAVLEAVKELKAAADKAGGEVEALKAKIPNPAQFVPVSVMTAVQNELAALKAGLTTDKVNQLVTVGLSTGRLLPAQKDWAMSLGNSDIAALSTYLDTVQPIAALSGTQTGGHAPEGKPKTLTADELAVCKNMGITEAQFLAANGVQ
jgi:phage I-like protein